MIKRVAVVSAVLSLSLAPTAVSQSRTNHSSPIEGVWRVAEIRFIRADTTIVHADPQPGLFIFAKSHYSSSWVPQNAARKSFQSRFEPTRDELAAACETLVVNSGTYEISGTQLTVRPVVTRMPEFSGGMLVYNFSLNGDVLSLEVVDERSRDGIKAPWLSRQRLTLKLLRVE